MTACSEHPWRFPILLSGPSSREGWGMHTIRIFLALVLLALAAPAAAAPRDIAIPPPLRDWTGRVLPGHERELCPSPGPGSHSQACGRPGELQLDVHAGRARISHRGALSPAAGRPRPESVRARR